MKSLDFHINLRIVSFHFSQLKKDLEQAENSSNVTIS